MKMISFCMAVSVSMSCIGGTEGVPDTSAQGKVVAKEPSLKELKDKFIGIIERMYADKGLEDVFTKDQLYRRGSMLGKLHPDKEGGSNYFFDKWYGLMQSLETPEVFTKQEALAWIEKSTGGAPISESRGWLNRAIDNEICEMYTHRGCLFPLSSLNFSIMEFLGEHDVSGYRDREHAHTLKEARILTRRIHQKIEKEGIQHLWIGSLEKALGIFKDFSQNIPVAEDELNLPLVPADEFKQGQDEFSEEDLICRGGCWGRI